ncbi:MAG TPA: NADH-quinone oxidoreductase subunit J [Planctomycetota bacterium]|nr:NADH-quinone oxidoreductase subunit J [Planctomycetota bacterium]
MAETLFYLSAALTLGLAAGVVLAKSPMHSVLSLLGSFFGLAVVYLLSGFQFLAAAQLVVYAGAILVLFLFVIMLLDLRAPESGGGFPRGRAAVGATLVAAAAAVLGLASALDGRLPEHVAAPTPGGIDRLDVMARALFGPYALAFEAAGLLLLVAMVAVIALAKRERGRRPGGAE